MSRDGGMWQGAALATSYREENLANGTSYTFEVRAVNALGEGEPATVTATPTQEITAIPTAPQNLAVTTDDATRAVLKWFPPANAWYEQSASKLQGYRVEVCTESCADEAGWSVVTANTGSAAPRHTDRGFAPGTLGERRYRVRAINLNGKAGPWSNTATLVPTQVSCSTSTRWTTTSWW